MILASRSPRRQQILSEAGFDFRIMPADIDETIDPGIPAREVARSLAIQKATKLRSKIGEAEVLLTADTTVVLEDAILGKPGDREEAISIISKLSDKTHEVITGCCLMSLNHSVSFSDSTSVEFRHLSLPEIEHYVDKFQPFDKAGAYGIQEWIGMVGIRAINGSYFNVVGLPIHRVYEELKEFSP